MNIMESATTPSAQLVKLIIDTTITCTAHIAVNKGIEYESSQLATKLTESKKEWVPKIIDEAKDDAVKADLFNSLPHRADPLVKAAFTTGLTHGCTKYAEYLLGIESK